MLEVMEEHALAGLTTFDTADIYGPSEQVLGAFREAWATRHPTLAPPEVFTKLVPNIFRERPTKATVEAAIQRSCAALRTRQLDCVQLHWWDYSVPGLLDVGKWLTELQAAGKIRSLGVTNLDCTSLRALLDAGVPIVSNQVQFSLLDRRPLNGMVQLCEQRGVKLLTYGTLAGGLLSDRYVAAPKQGLPFVGPRYPPVDLNTSSLKMYWRNVGSEPGWRSLRDTLRAIADRHSTTVAAVALRWAMDAGPVHPIVGMRNASHISDNLAALALQLDAADRARIDEALKACPGPQGDCYSEECS